MVQDLMHKTSESSLDSFLEEVRSLLQRQRVVEGLISRQSGPNQDLLESMTYRQHLTEMQNHLNTHHPADIAFVLESLPREDRQRVWNQVCELRGGAILLELSENIRRSLIAAMSRNDMLTVVKQVGIDDLSTLASSVPKDVLEDVYASLDQDS